MKAQLDMGTNNTSLKHLKSGTKRHISPPPPSNMMMQHPTTRENYNHSYESNNLIQQLRQHQNSQTVREKSGKSSMVINYKIGANQNPGSPNEEEN